MTEGDDKSDFEDYGLYILTTAIISILISAPLGSILTNSLGPRLLAKEATVEPSKSQDDESGSLPKRSVTPSDSNDD